jgi:hypothetical protein
MEIKTNNHWHNFLFGYELPCKIAESEFDYIDSEELQCASFIKYKGDYYPLADFIAIVKPGGSCGFAHIDFDGNLKDWHGIHTDTFFSGIVICVSNDGEQYKIGSCYA